MYLVEKSQILRISETGDVIRKITGTFFHVIAEMATPECAQLLANAETYMAVAKAQEEANTATFARLKVCSREEEKSPNVNFVFFHFWL